MRYIPEGLTETDITDKKLTVDDINRAIKLINGRPIVRIRTQQSVDGGRVDIIGETEKGSLWIIEHQDLSGKADLIHSSKLLFYTFLAGQKKTIEGGLLLCDNVSNDYKKVYETFRELSAKRKRWSGFNVHFLKAQWNGDNFVPELFDTVENEMAPQTTLNHYKNFVDVYAKEWAIQREDYKKANDRAITLWHRIPELDNNYMAYIHTLSNSVKIGLHCEPKRKVSDDEKTFLKSVSPQGWIFRDSAKMKATIELTLPLDSSQEQWADETENLKRIIRQEVLNQTEEKQNGR